ncbi:MAG TPA: bifunctional hydroxymethylpyrimidine kinase/phosphomethylpyrimidine kinase [Ruminococcaceae bacterium]|nr:bifunctional hydroxymethylpyrimidine kinase/phosphomethylpyrimidine kinase [Oscillospiraceae bacterium]
MKKVLTIAGSDSSGGAGIQADLKTFAAHGVFGMSVIVSVVAENTSTVLDLLDVTPYMVEKQIDAVFTDIEVDAVKIGMLSSSACMKAAAGRLWRYMPRNVVVDPVMLAKNGSPLMAPGAMDTLIKEILPYAGLLTPNIHEAQRISGLAITDVSGMEKAAERIRNMGCENVLVKGGHIEGDAVDVLYDGQEFFHFTEKRIDTKNTHGTGCTYSSAIAANLALGLALPIAVRQAKKYVTDAIAHAPDIGKGNGPTNHFYRLYQYGLEKGLKYD